MCHVIMSTPIDGGYRLGLAMIDVCDKFEILSFTHVKYRNEAPKLGGG